MSAPTSTYRLQVKPSFTLHDAAAVVPYLAELGVGAVYCSPLLTAAAGSDHGYDTVDPTTIDVARGGENGWAGLVAACREHGLELVVDIVPNHMGVRTPRANPAWWSVLSEGEDSPYHGWFDVDWTRAPILLPILGSAADLDAVRIEPDGDGHVLRYHDHVLPLAPGSYRDGDDVATVLARQHYQLADWRDANERLNYRRFFAIVDLAGVRVDDPDVFDATHSRVRRWIDEGDIAGLRIDHPDGLRDPGEYLARLREAMPDGWLVTEKILAPGERLPDWAHDGTVGYDALREVTDVLLPPATAGAWDVLWRRIGGGSGTALEAEDEGKAEVVRTQLVTEARRLASLAELEWRRGSEAAKEAGTAAASVVDPDPEVMSALQAIAAEFRVYRTYLPFGVDHLDGAVDRAREKQPELGATIDRVAALLRDGSTEVAQRFQQFTGPVLAKGLEDTAFYRWNRQLVLNEVGGDPGHTVGSLDEWHAAQRSRQATWPQGMTALSTHDTKRSEDVRAALLALAEAPEVFEPFVTHVARECGIDDAGFAFGLAQMLVAGPDDAERLTAWAVKAVREANQSSSWTAPNAVVEAAIGDAVTAILSGTDARGHELRDDVLAALHPAAGIVALAQKAIQLVMPGVPDVYQGTEVLDDSTVDPDNRRPVDFAALAAGLPASAPESLDDEAAVARAKQWLVRQVLRLRRDHPERFSGYEELRATGAAADHCVAFDRGGVVVVAPRQPLQLARDGGWRDTALPLPAGTWTDVLTGREHAGELSLVDALDRLPVAVLTRG